MPNRADFLLPEWSLRVVRVGEDDAYQVAAQAVFYVRVVVGVVAGDFALVAYYYPPHAEPVENLMTGFPKTNIIEHNVDYL